MIQASARVSTMALMLLACGIVFSMARASKQPPSFPSPDLVFTLRDGFLIPAREWLPPADAPLRGVILALHGFTDSRDAWELPAPAFAAAGYAVFAPDQRGFGATATRGVWSSTQTMVDDAADLAGQLRHRFPVEKLILMGESMGGAVAMCLAARSPGAADAYVFLAPALWGRAQMMPGIRAALTVARLVAPGWQLTGREVPLDIVASDNRDALLRLAHDPLTLRSSSVDVLVGLVDLMDEAQAVAPLLAGAPMLILHGVHDQVIPPAATAAAWAKLPAGVRRGVYLNGYHLLLRDRDRALVIADILAWLGDPGWWLPSGADVNAGSWVAAASR